MLLREWLTCKARGGAAPGLPAVSELLETAVEGEWPSLISAAVEVDLAKEDAATDNSHTADRFVSREEAVVTRGRAGSSVGLSTKIPSRPTQSSGRLQNE